MKKKIIITLIVILVVCGLCYAVNKHSSKVSDVPKNTSRIETKVTTRSKAKDTSDVNLKQNFVVKVNGETKTLQLKRGEGTDITQTIDLSPLAEMMKPKWEIGVGGGVAHSKFVGAVAVQRNYNVNTGIEVIGTKDCDSFGVIVLYKKLLK